MARTRPPIAPEAITDNGWQFYEKCRCTNVLMYKYRNPGKPMLELRWYPRNFSFKVMKGAQTVVALSKVKDMDALLKEI
jgi:hypothetical protein